MKKAGPVVITEPARETSQLRPTSLSLSHDSDRGAIRQAKGELVTWHNIK